MTRIFSGDYSTGDFSQYSRIINNFVNITAQNARTNYDYPQQIVCDDPDSGYSGRYELRSGDGRSQARGDELAYAPIGSTRWYAWSWKFDANFPNNRDQLSWGSAGGFKASDGGDGEWGSGVISFGVYPHPGFTADNGFLQVIYAPQITPLVPHPTYGGGRILRLPIKQGQWQDFKMRVYWKQDNTGTLDLWLDGVRQTFESMPGFPGGTTFTGQTVSGGVEPLGVNWDHGLYRDPAATHTEIMYHRGYRMASTEGGL